MFDRCLHVFYRFEQFSQLGVGNYNSIDELFKVDPYRTPHSEQMRNRHVKDHHKFAKLQGGLRKPKETTRR